MSRKSDYTYHAPKFLTLVKNGYTLETYKSLKPKDRKRVAQEAGFDSSYLPDSIVAWKDRKDNKSESSFKYNLRLLSAAYDGGFITNKNECIRKFSELKKIS